MPGNVGIMVLSIRFPRQPLSTRTFAMASSMLKTKPRRSSSKVEKSAADNRRWQAVVGRQVEADGQFVFAVRTTGVYCRPSCPARRARRENVRFFDTPLAARQAGFRACKRCRPDEPDLTARHRAVVAEACRRIHKATEAPSVESLASSAGMSRFHFQRVFRQVTGIAPGAYMTAERGNRVRDGLSNSSSVTATIYEAGFRSAAPFYSSATELLGMTPGQYRAGGAGETIRFAVGQCWLGAILVAATERGVCAVLLNDRPGPAIEELKERFPRAQLQPGDRRFARYVARAVAMIERPSVASDLPLDVRGTAFQLRVWQALQKIPPGTTLTYSQLAKRLGIPRAVRAVASACAANPVAVAIPCHRVVRTTGALAGYYWGIERKRALLDREAEG